MASLKPRESRIGRSQHRLWMQADDVDLAIVVMCVDWGSHERVSGQGVLSSDLSLRKIALQSVGHTEGVRLGSNADRR